MKKTFLFLLVFLVCIGSGLLAQSNFIKFLKDTTISENRFFKNEIYSFVRFDEKSKTYTFIFFEDSTKTTANIVEKLNYIPGNLSPIKSEFVFIKDDRNYTISLNSIKKVTLPVLLVSEKNKVLNVPLSNDIKLKKDEWGTKFRLIIPNHVTIFYYADQIKHAESDFWNNLTWIHYTIAGFLILSLLMLLLWLIYRIKKVNIMEPKFALFNSNSLDDFARDQYISNNKLIKYNKDKIPKDYFDQNFPKSERNKVKNDLRDDELIVGYKVNIRKIFSSKEKKPTSTLETVEGQFEHKDSSDIKSDQESYLREISQMNADLVRQFKKIEENILGKIEGLNTRNQTEKELNRITNELKSASAENKNLLEKSKELNQEKVNLEGEVETFKAQTEILSNEKKELNKELNQIKEKVIFPDFLVNYAKNLAGYLDLCEQVCSKAYEYYNKVSQQNQGDAKIIGQLLLKFQSNKPSNIGNWEQTILNISNSGIITDIQMIKRLRQINSNDEKIREFQRVLFQDVLEKYSSSTFILAEEFRNLGKFLSSQSEGVMNIQNTFTKLTTELTNKIKTTGLEIKYVPLFVNYMEYSGHTKLANESLSSSYQGITGLQKNSVAEIVNYGFESTLGKSDTKIILA